MGQRNADQRFSLAGQVALVTGAGRGIGRVLALALAEAGAHIVIGSRTVRELERVRCEIQERGRASIACYLDVLDCAAIDAAVATAVDRFGRLDLLVNNAGTSRRIPALEMAEADWDAIFDTNVKGLFFCAQAAGRMMARQGKGKIINIASALGFVTSEDLVAYCTSKAAVVHMTRALALEWARYRINVNAIAPTTTRTPLMAQRLADPQIHESYVRNIPLGRVGLPEDLIGALLFLASPASDFVTGQTIIVDGGFTVH